MVISTAHHPDFLCEVTSSDEAQAWLLSHLGHVIHHHILVHPRSTGHLLVEAMKQLKSTLPGWVYQQLELLLTGKANRIVQVDVPNSVSSECFLDDSCCMSDLLAIAVAGGVDAVLVTRDGKAAAELQAEQNGWPAPSSLFTLVEYGKSAVYKRESMGSVQLAGKKKTFLCRDVVEPFIRWSGKVRLVDRYICKAFFDDPSKPGWENFKRTIQCLFHLWHQNCKVQKICFEVYTTAVWSIDRTWGEQWNIARTVLGPPDAYCQAEFMSNDLGIKNNFAIHMVDPRRREDGEAADVHDRRLFNSQGMSLNFTGGFDLVGSDDKLEACVVVLDDCRIKTLADGREEAVWPRRL